MFYSIMMMTQAASVPVDATAQAAAAARAAPVQPPITAQDVAQYIDPGQVAAYVPPPPPMSDSVAIFGKLFSIIESIAIGLIFAIGMFLLARIIHAFMIHRSVRKAIEAKSGDAAALIDKLNKPYEIADEGTKRHKTGDDRIALVLMAIGLALGCFGLLQSDPAVIRSTMGAALFPLFVGGALLINRRMQKSELAQEQAADGR